MIIISNRNPNPTAMTAKEESTLEDKMDGIMFPLPLEEKGKLWDMIEEFAESLAKERAVDGFNLISELRTRLLVDQNQDGEFNSSMTELLDMWDRVHAYMDTFLAEKRKEGAK